MSWFLVLPLSETINLLIVVSKPGLCGRDEHEEDRGQRGAQAPQAQGNPDVWLDVAGVG